MTSLNPHLTKDMAIEVVVDLTTTNSKVCGRARALLAVSKDMKGIK